jgi:hypothetical protein
VGIKCISKYIQARKVNAKADPFIHVTPLPQDNGERFMSDYINCKNFSREEEEEFNNNMAHIDSKRYPCPRCLGNSTPILDQGSPPDEPSTAAAAATAATTATARTTSTAKSTGRTTARKRKRRSIAIASTPIQTPVQHNQLQQHNTTNSSSNIICYRITTNIIFIRISNSNNLCSQYNLRKSKYHNASRIKLASNCVRILL